jgi:hypothetical protein
LVYAWSVAAARAAVEAGTPPVALLSDPRP